MFQRQHDLFIACFVSLCLLACQGCNPTESLAESTKIQHNDNRDEQTVYGLGTEVDPNVYATWNISVFPDGSGLPAGSGTAKQGHSLFENKCVRCHGFCGANNNCQANRPASLNFDSIGSVQNQLCYPKLSSIATPAWPLTDTIVTAPSCVPPDASVRAQSQEQVIGTYWPSSTTLFDYIRRAMPFWNPQSLSSDETYALTAYLLYVNDLIDYQTTVDENNLADITMPNKDSFIDCSVVSCRPDTHNTECMDNCPPLVQSTGGL